MIALTIAALVQATSYAPIPKAEWPDYVAAASSAIAKRDPVAIESTYRDIEEIPADGGHSVISAQDALKLLSGCSQSDARHVYEATYVIDYACPARRKVAKGCDAGDLGVMVNNERSSFIVTHRRLFRPTGEQKCLPFVPPIVPKAPERGN